MHTSNHFLFSFPPNNGWLDAGLEASSGVVGKMSKQGGYFTIFSVTSALNNKPEFPSEERKASNLRALTRLTSHQETTFNSVFWFWCTFTTRRMMVRNTCRGQRIVPPEVYDHSSFYSLFPSTQPSINPGQVKMCLLILCSGHLPTRTHTHTIL